MQWDQKSTTLTDFPPAKLKIFIQQTPSHLYFILVLFLILFLIVNIKLSAFDGPRVTFSVPQLHMHHQWRKSQTPPVPHQQKENEAEIYQSIFQVNTLFVASKWL